MLTHPAAGASALLLAGCGVVALRSFAPQEPPEPRAVAQERSQPAPTAHVANRDALATQPEQSETRPAAETLVTLAQQRPDAAVRYFELLAREMPAKEAQLGELLVMSLLHAGHHEAAASFAAGARGASRTQWVTAAFHAWGRHQPETALDVALNFDEPERRRDAFRAAVSGWSQVNSRQLLECAASFPSGPERDFAVITALRRWRATDPAAAARWLESHSVLVAQIPGRALIDED